jgi:hypothetical protein
LLQHPDSIKHQQPAAGVQTQPLVQTETPLEEQEPDVRVAIEGEAPQPFDAQQDTTPKSVYAARVNHWPVKTDSLLMPKSDDTIQVTVNKMPEYNRQSFFAKDTLIYKENQSGRFGIAGDPVPYSVRTDNVLTPLLIFGVLMLMYSVRRSSRLFAFQLRNFFHTVRTDSSIQRETAAEKRYLLYMDVYTAVILGLMFFFYSKAYIAETYVTYSEYSLMAIFVGIAMGYFVFEYLLQKLVNNIFFSQHANELWSTSKFLVTAIAGVLLTPMLLLMAYFGLSIENSLIYTLSIVVFVKILLIYKSFIIFFQKTGDFLQNFLYFCALEIVPPLLIWGILVYVANFLKVNY